MVNSNDFLGTGWAFPPSFQKENIHSVVMVSGNEDIQESIRIILTTRVGERIMQPMFGSDVDRLVFEPINLGLNTLVKDVIEKSLLVYEPRIAVDNIDINQDNQLDGVIQISIDYMIRTTNTRNNIVFPFYLNEGNNIGQ